MVGALIYLAVTTRPDISFAISYLAQFNELRYLKGTLEYGITYRRKSADDGNFVRYADVDWGNCPIDRRSCTGYVFMIGDGPVS